MSSQAPSIFKDIEPGFLILAAAAFCSPLMLFVPGIRHFVATRLHTVQPENQRRIAALDGIRGIAALLVFFSHYASVLPENSSMRPFVGFWGFESVMAFAFISGYVLYGIFLDRSLDIPKIHDYFKRRFLRLFPLYAVHFLLLMLGIVLTSGWRHVVVPWQPLLSDLLMIDLWHFDFRIASPTWSLYPEVLFSALLPIYVIVCRFNMKAHVIFLAAFMLYSYAPSKYLLLLSCMWAGMIFRQIHDRYQFTYPAKGNLITDFLFAGGIMFFLYGSSYDGNLICDIFGCSEIIIKWLDFFGIRTMSVKVVMVVVSMLLLLYWRVTHAILSSPPLVLLGTISYSVYLIHYSLLFVVAGDYLNMQNGTLHFTLSQNSSGEAVLLFVYTPAVLFVAAMTYIFIERPFIKRGKQQPA